MAYGFDRAVIYIAGMNQEKPFFSIHPEPLKLYPTNNHSSVSSHKT